MQPTESAWIERFASHMKHERRMSAQTVSAYLADIAQLAAFCDARKIARFSDIDAIQVRTFAATDHARGLSARSIQRRISRTHRIRGNYRWQANPRYSIQN